MQFGLILLCFLPSLLFSQTLCLNMIVKNERDVIARCLESVKPHIDYWVIVDTGSTDGTQDIIRHTLKDIPGELHERVWKNFAHNRNEAKTLALGTADYLLFVDADEVVKFSHQFDKQSLHHDIYNVYNYQQMGKFTRTLIAKNSPEIYWKGVLHEALITPPLFSKSLITSAHMESFFQDGCRAKNPRKFHEDAQILCQALEDEPNNSRYRFYLAQSYSLAGEYEKALESYTQRTQQVGDYPEYIYSLYQVGRHLQYLKYPEPLFVRAYSKAFLMAPHRLETVYELSEYFKEKHPLIAYILARYGVKQLETIPKEIFDHDIHIHSWVYDWSLKFNYGQLALMFGQYHETERIYRSLIKSSNVPTEIINHMQSQLAFIHR